MHHGPNRGHIGAIAPCLFNIDVNLPINAGQGPRVFHQSQPFGLVKYVSHFLGDAQQFGPIIPRKPQMHRFIAGRSALDPEHFYLDARQLFKRCYQLFHDQIAVKLGAIPAVFPCDGFKLNLRNRVFGLFSARGVLI